MAEEKQSIIKPERNNWKHYFGGFGFLIIILQLITGLYLIFFFEPSLGEAYNTIREIANKVFLGDIMRNLHRWIPALLFIAILIHTIRSFIRSDFRHPRKKVVWMTGVLLLPVLFFLLVTGLIVPWEWKGYWFMEMIPNYFETIPVIGDSLKAFFLESFTIPRYYVLHILVFPLIAFVLIDYHLLSKLRKRGIFKYLMKHTLVCLPLLLILLYLAVDWQLPSADPEEIPMPLEGEWLLAPEWYFLTILLPFMLVRGIWIPILAIGLPVLLVIIFAVLPYVLKSRDIDQDQSGDDGNLLQRIIYSIKKKMVVNIIVVASITLLFTGLLFKGNYNSPTNGCNSCHNVSRGIRMGVPPADQFKDRDKLPKLEDNDWMMGHWYYPTEIW